MKTFVVWAKNGLALVGLLALGYWLGSAHAVNASSYAQSGPALQFQLAGVNETSSLLVYHPDTRTVYVYRAATVGNSWLQCSYKFQLDKPGGPIQRIQCPVQSALP